MNSVTRCGAWVLRPAGPRTCFVQDLLAVLVGAGCEWAPRPGAWRPLLQTMRWVRRLPDVTAGLIDFDLAHRGRRADDLATALKELARLGQPGSGQSAVALLPDLRAAARRAAARESAARRPRGGAARPGRDGWNSEQC